MRMIALADSSVSMFAASANVCRAGLHLRGPAAVDRVNSRLA
jgi:hypothetical protein